MSDHHPEIEPDPAAPPPCRPGWRRILAMPGDLLDLQNLTGLVRLAGVVAMGFAAGFLGRYVHLPLPFVLGPLFITAALGLAGLPVGGVRRIRPAAQLVIGAAIGIQFTRAVVIYLVDLLPLIVATALMTIAVCGVAAALMIVIAGLDRKTAFFATAPAGAAEMANIAARHGGEPEPIMVAQTIRVVLTVSVAPFLVTYFSDNGAVHAYAQVAVLPFLETMIVAVVGMAGGYLMAWTRFPNSWFIGPLIAAALAAAFGLVAGRMPDLMLIIAQVVIGCSLGAQFRREFLTRLLPTMLAAIAAVTVALVVTAAAAIACAHLLSLSAPAMVLAFAPAGMAEMTLTGKVLGLDATLISGFHVVRIVMVMLLCVPAFHLFDWIAGRCR
jgi:membrane AbrB-like protein